MRILFDLRSVGLGNNGGSLTLIKSANTLSALGHDVKIIDSGRNQHTWAKLEVEHIKPKTKEKVPDADVVIATGYKSVFKTVGLPERCGLKTHWIRGWETWVMPEQAIVKRILKQPTVKLVNGLCLVNKLNSLGFESHLVRPGYDLHDYKPIDRYSNNNTTITIGGLFNRRHSKIKRHDWILRVARSLKKNFVQLLMYGADPDPKLPEIYYYRSQPNTAQKNALYNAVDIWLAPAMQEGLHMPPAEAMLTGCPVIGTNAPMSGMMDYLIDGKTGLISKNNFQSFYESTNKLLKDQKLREELGKNARNRVLEIGDRAKNMRKMVKLFESLI